MCIKFTFILIFASLLTFGQNNERKFRYSCAYLAYTWQGTNNIESGIILLFKLKPKENRDNIGLVVAGNLSYLNNSFYLTPLPKFHFRKSFKNKKDLSFHSYLGYTYTSYNNKYDHRISPETGLGYKLFHLTTKLNIPITNYQDNYTLPFGLSIKLSNY